MNNELPNQWNYTSGPPQITVNGSRGGYLDLAFLRVLGCGSGTKLVHLVDYERYSLEHVMWRNIAVLKFNWRCWVEVAAALSVCGIGEFLQGVF